VEQPSDVWRVLEGSLKNTVQGRWNPMVCIAPDGRSFVAELVVNGGILGWDNAPNVLFALRWFADEVEREDAFFGPPDPAAAGPSALEQAFEAATAASRTLRKAPDNDALLALYSLYKQASSGDVTGDRPGALDMVGRAKYDAWAKRKGVGRDDAMRQYVELVEGLKRREAA
jgi:carboxylesterase